MAQNFFPLISHLIESIDADATGKGNLALQFFADGKVERDAFESAAQMATEFGAMPQPGDAIACGTTAGALCQVFAKSNPLSTECSLAALRGVVKDGAPRLIRVDLKGHSYVVEQIAGTPARGNVYQSNVAVLSNPDLGISLAKYLREQQNPVDLEAYLADLAALSDLATARVKRQELYEKLFTVPSYLRNPRVVAPKIDDAGTSAEAYSLGVRRITYQSFTPSNTLSGVQRILTFSNLSKMVEAQAIYYRCVS